MIRDHPNVRGEHEMAHKIRYCGDPTKQGFESIQNGYRNYFVNRNANEKGFLLDVDLNVLVLIGICRIVAPVRAAHNLPIGAQNLSVVIP